MPNDPGLLTQLTKHKVDVTVLPVQKSSVIRDVLSSLLSPFAILVGLYFLFRRSIRFGGNGGGGGVGNPMIFGKSKAKIQMIPDTGVNFDDVAGCDGVKIELEEVVDFLKQPDAYTKNGCKIPRGVILDGPPGTGKVSRFISIIFNSFVSSNSSSILSPRKIYRHY